MERKLLDTLDLLHDTGRHTEALTLLEGMPTEERDAEWTGLHARALNNLGRYDEAAKELLACRKAGEGDPLWHYRLGYALYYLGREGEARAEFEAVLRLTPEDEDAARFLDWCEKALTVKRQRGVEMLTPALYTEEERAAVLRHIEEHFGPVETALLEVASPDIAVHIAVIPPCPEHDYTVLCTVGMGASPMRVPPELAGRGLERAELMMALPAHWRVQDPDEQWHWPVRWLKIAARVPVEEGSFLEWGQAVPTGGPFCRNRKWNGFLVSWPVAFGTESFRCTLPGGEPVNFYQLVPLYQDEMDFLFRSGPEALVRYLPERALEVVDLSRESVCRYLSVKDFAIPTGRLRPLLRGWDGPTGCIATDRILVDGCPVGYMYREEPDYDGDSGWRFLAGDESDEYLQDLHNSDFYDLNTLCNYDAEIMPFLTAPVGAAYERDLDGRLVRLEEEDLL